MTDEEVVPVLRVDDATRAVAWYGRLGFMKEWEHQFGMSGRLFGSRTVRARPYDPRHVHPGLGHRTPEPGLTCGNAGVL